MSTGKKIAHQMIARENIAHYIHKPDKIKAGTSNKVKSLPPVIFHTIPVALSIPISSNGDWMAFRAASLARVLPAQRYTAYLKWKP